MNQYLASAPCGARHKHCIHVKSLAAQVGRFVGSSVLTLARRLNCSIGLVGQHVVSEC
jgi:hypothetical protein